MRKLVVSSVVFGLLALTACTKEKSARNMDGTCKGGFVDAYNDTVTAINAVVDLQKKPSTSGAEMASALESAQAKCKNLLTNFADGETCEASRTAKAEDLSENCGKVDANLKALREARTAPAMKMLSDFGSQGSI